jgi:hemolysin III
MTKSKKIIKQKLRAVQKQPRAHALLRALRATGLFQWQRPPTKSEWVLDVMTHGIGIGLAIAALVVLEIFAVLKGDPWAVVSCAIFGLTMFTLYFGSTMCHAMMGQKSECFFEVWDSVAIYALIAGTYTPFCLVNMRGPLGWSVFGLMWAIVAIGAIMKFKNPKQQPRWLVGLYLLMGLTCVFILPQMIRAIPPRGMWWVLAGGASYVVGTLFYLWRGIKFSHAIWLLFVIGGTIGFFFAVLFGSIIDY